MACNQIDVQVGARLRELRFQNSLSVHALAQAVGVTETRLLMFENGEARIDAMVMADMCRSLNVRPGAFFSWLPIKKDIQVAKGGELHAA